MSTSFKIIKALKNNRAYSALETIVLSIAPYPRHPDVAPVGDLRRGELVKLDKSYRNMYLLHRNCHLGLVRDIRSMYKGCDSRPRLLEIAAGSGWNATKFIQAGFDYCGLDISEPAVALLMRRHPEARFLNIGISDAGVLASDAFDVVVSFSMLEHLAEYERALSEMVRIARQHLFVTFFEGLADEPEDKVATYPFDRRCYSFFGRKFLDLQSSYADKFYWNRYSRATIERISREAGAKSVEFLSSGNRSYLKNETILHVSK